MLRRSVFCLALAACANLQAQETPVAAGGSFMAEGKASGIDAANAEALRKAAVCAVRALPGRQDWGAARREQLCLEVLLLRRDLWRAGYSPKGRTSQASERVECRLTVDDMANLEADLRRVEDAVSRLLSYPMVFYSPPVAGSEAAASAETPEALRILFQDLGSTFGDQERFDSLLAAQVNEKKVEAGLALELVKKNNELKADWYVEVRVSKAGGARVLIYWADSAQIIADQGDLRRKSDYDGLLRGLAASFRSYLDSGVPMTVYLERVPESEIGKCRDHFNEFREGRFLGDVNYRLDGGALTWAGKVKIGDGADIGEELRKFMSGKLNRAIKVERQGATRATLRFLD